MTYVVNVPTGILVVRDGPCPVILIGVPVPEPVADESGKEAA